MTNFYIILLHTIFFNNFSLRSPHNHIRKSSIFFSNKPLVPAAATATTNQPNSQPNHHQKQLLYKLFVTIEWAISTESSC